MQRAAPEAGPAGGVDAGDAPGRPPGERRRAAPRLFVLEDRASPRAETCGPTPRTTTRARPPGPSSSFDSVFADRSVSWR
ncbi:hypothetical protein ABZ114_30450, partial [Streptomyces albidoflavus]|uniref:hypothetical protein n=1 Tax=Streptomyces albidoflavus TaxID=1886 RepID=UPI0033AA1297